jgi:nicotinic acid phosphoribosyltransferase
MRRLSALLCEEVVQPTGDSYSADHLIFGMGDAVLQEVNRDTQRFGIKCSNLTTNRF